MPSKTTRFHANEQLYKDFSILDPKRFPAIVAEGIPKTSLEKVANLAEVDCISLRSELLSFDSNFSRRNVSMQYEFKDNSSEEEITIYNCIYFTIFDQIDLH